MASEPRTGDALAEMTIAEARDAFRAGDAAPTEMTEACLARAEAAGALNEIGRAHV